MFEYSCVTCGEEIKEEEMLVALAPLVLDGTTDYIKGLNPLYITKKDLDELIANTAEVEGIDERCNVISMEYLLQVAYRPINREKLIAPAKNAEEAYRTYLESYQRIKDKLAGKEEVKEEEKEEETSSGFSFFDEEEDDAGSEESIWKGISIPGFNNEQSIQLCENFPEGQCNCRVRMKKGYGYSFKVLRDGTTESVTSSFYCPCCKNEVMDCAFDKRQILVGLVGFQKVGKTCLMLALCNYLMEEGGTLKVPHEDTYRRFIDQFTLYRNGCALPKTDAKALGQNLLNPSVLIDDVIWTFVDVPGELINDGSGQLKVADIIRNAKFKAILRCDAYILCTTKKELQEPINRNATSDIFSKFLQFASETETNTSAGLDENGRHFPVILSMTQMDKQMEVLRPKKGDIIPYSANHYRLWKEYGGMMNEGMGRIIDSIINISYVTPISTSAYGFQPYDPDQGTDPDDPRATLILAAGETYRRPQPKNVDKITKWVRQTVGLEDNVVLDDGATRRVVFDDYDRDVGHWSDDQALSICQMFVNPSEWDFKWMETIGGGPLMWFKRKMIMHDYEKTVKGNV